MTAIEPDVTGAEKSTDNERPGPRIVGGNGFGKAQSFSSRRASSSGPRSSAAALQIQAQYRGYIVRRLSKSQVQTHDLRRAVGLLNVHRAGFSELLLYLLFCVITCMVLSLQYSVRNAYEVDTNMRLRIDHVNTADGSTWEDVGLNPDQVLDWTEAALVEMYESNDIVVVDLDKYYNDTEESSSSPAGQQSSSTSRESGALCEQASIPACCRFSAWREGVKAEDYDTVHAEHKFGHNRVSTPLIVKVVNRKTVECEHHSDEDDPLSEIYPTCYSSTEENHTALVDEDADPEIWQEYDSEFHGYIMPIDLGLFRLPVDAGLCQLEKARQFGWITTAAKEVDVEFATYNGHYEVWTLTKVSVTWSLGGLPTVTLTTHTAPIRDEYGDAHGGTRAVVEALYLAMLLYYIVDTIKRTLTVRLNGWLFVDVAVHGCAIANTVLWVVISIEGYRFRMFDFAVHQLNVDEDAHHRWDEFLHLMHEIEVAETDFFAYTVVQSVMLMLLTVRLFKYLAFHQQFSLVTSTLLKAYANLAHFMLVFFIILCLFAFVGHNLLGHKMVLFSTYGDAINSMLSLIVFDDTVSFTTIMLTAPIVGHIFYWTYFVLSSLMLINVLLAILLDAYSSVSEKAKTSNYIWTDIIVQYRLALYWTRHRTVYRDIARVHSLLYQTAKRYRSYSLAEAKQLLEDFSLPSYVVWNVIVVLEGQSQAAEDEVALEKGLQAIDDVKAMTKSIHHHLRMANHASTSSLPPSPVIFEQGNKLSATTAPR